MSLTLYIIGGIALGFILGYLLSQNQSKNLIQHLNAMHSAELQRLKEQNEAHSKNLENQFRVTANDIFQEKQAQLSHQNETQLSLLLKPLGEQLIHLNNNMAENRANAASQKTEVEMHLKQLLTQTQTLGTEAAALTRALKGCGKIQGDWGEQILENILQNSGLRKDEEYRIQHNVRTNEGQNLRPDVEILCPGNRLIIIDSKTSLTAYANYVSAETYEAREIAAKENVASLRRHVDELAAKRYDKHIKEALDYVLMFIPNEGSYILALQTDKLLADYAFKKNIILINPTNLMLTLRLIYNLWQSERQNKNIEEVVRQSALLYDKFVGYVDTLKSVGKNLESAQQSYERALRQLHEGQGNVVHRLETLKQLGITPSKQIPKDLIDLE